MMRRTIISKIASGRPASCTALRSFSHTVSRLSRATSSPLAASKFVDIVLGSFLRQSGLEKTLLRPLKLVNSDKTMRQSGLQNVQAEPGRVTFELIIDRRHTNRLDILHGGTIASMVDFGGSLAVASMGLYSTGVSTDLNVSYLGSGGVVGDVVKVEARCDKVGKNLAYTSVTFTNDKGELVARGSHTKFIKVAHQSQHDIGGPYNIPAPVRRLVNQQTSTTPKVEDLATEENKAEEQSVEGPEGNGKSTKEQSIEDPESSGKSTEEQSVDGPEGNGKEEQSVEDPDGNGKSTTN
ncbi:HotDog domain containing protein [Rhypophila decipiens]